MNFTKMHGTGNDFVIVDGRDAERDWSALASAMCDRHFGVGSDGILVVAPSEAADFRMRMFNPDGSEAEICANGIRCFTKYVIDQALWRNGPVLNIETLAGVHAIKATLHRGSVQSVRVGMGAPRLRPEEIPVAADGEGPVMDHPITVDGQTIPVTCVSMGNPHAVAFIERSVKGWPLDVIGPDVEHHSSFPNRVNFEIVNVLDRRRLVARVWERGAGITLACGSGACAIAVAARLHGLVDDTVEVSLPGGTLRVTWDGQGEVLLEGTAELVFRGDWPDGALGAG